MRIYITVVNFLINFYLMFKLTYCYYNKYKLFNNYYHINCTKYRKNLIYLKKNNNSNDCLWEKQWLMIETMRNKIPAAVDTMGADALSKREESKDSTFRFQTLIACMLSPQTKDQQTSIAFDNLIKLVSPSPLMPSTLIKKDIKSIEEAIKNVQFKYVKAENILLASQRCVDEYNDDIPKDINELLSFKGVGPKIAYLTFTIAYDNTLGICVDTHVHRITNRLGWVDTWLNKSNGPEHTRKQLQLLIPKEKWGYVNNLIVGFGQTICSARVPKCQQCLLITTCKYYNNENHMRK